MAPNEVTDALQAALRFAQSGDFGSAEREYRDIVARAPETPDAWNMLAVVLRERGALDEARHASDRAVELRPAIAPYWLIRGNIDADLRRWADAEANYRRACEIDPNFAEARYRLGLMLQQRCLFDEALGAYSEALRLAPDVAEIYWQTAEALVSLDRYEHAVSAYEQAFRRDPQRALDRRGALDCMGRLHFEALPQFWHDEIQAFFQRRDLEKGAYVPLALKALVTLPTFRAALASAGDVEIGPWLAEPLFVAVLRDCLVSEMRFEHLLTRLRARLLLDESARKSVPHAFAVALAHQCFANEFVFDESEQERAAVQSLRSSVEARLRSGAPVDWVTLRDLLVLALYTRLDGVQGIERALDGASLDQDVRMLLQRSVADRRIERRLRESIPAIVPIESGVSEAVRSMYEEHPYPRWFTIDRVEPMPLAEWFAREAPTVPAPAMPAGARILVAGCGTGHDALWLASNIADARVLGVDLSLTSLSYGRRMADALGVTNIEFRHGDILRLAELDERFDFIASTGVLHHMRDPQAGLAVLSQLLVPGGLMKLGFYSRRARVGVTAARDIIAAEGIGSTEAEIRAFRQRVFASAPDSALHELKLAPDLYSMSMCRDLLFHVQEHQYTLPEIDAMLKTCGLTFLGLSDLPPEALGRYRAMFPHDEAMNDVASWDALEQRYPDTFSRMFLFWCRSTR